MKAGDDEEEEEEEEEEELLVLPHEAELPVLAFLEARAELIFQKGKVKLYNNTRVLLPEKAAGH